MNQNSHLFFHSAKSSLLYCIANERFEDFCLVADEINHMIKFHQQGSGAYLTGNDKIYFNNFFINFVYDVINQSLSHKENISLEYKKLSIPTCLEYFEKANLISAEQTLSICFLFSKEPQIFKEIEQRWARNIFLSDQQFKTYFLTVPSMKNKALKSLDSITKTFEDQEIYYLHQKISTLAKDSHNKDNIKSRGYSDYHVEKSLLQRRKI